MSIHTGDLLPGGYQVKELLGEGGYGAVYAGYDTGLEREVAIKVFTRDIKSHAAQRFYDEGRLLARLNHPHIVQVFAVGQLDHQCSYLVMEKFGQGSLAHHFTPQNRPSIELAVAITYQLLIALDQAHKKDILHRDIKPANLLFDIDKNWVKLCDFGIARSRSPLDNQADTTREGHVVGTTHYIAPERFQGIADDMRSDLYSVGVLFYWLLVGKKPFETYAGEAITPEVLLYRIFHQPIDGLEHVPRRIARVCLSLLARQAEHRSSSAQQALNALQDAWSLPETLSHPHQVSTSSEPWVQDTIADESFLSYPHPESHKNRSPAVWILLGIFFMLSVWFIFEEQFNQAGEDAIVKHSRQQTSIIILGEDPKIQTKTKPTLPTPPISTTTTPVSPIKLKKSTGSHKESTLPNKKKNRKTSRKKSSIKDESPFISPQ